MKLAPNYYRTVQLVLALLFASAGLHVLLQISFVQAIKSLALLEVAYVCLLLWREGPL